MNLWPSCRRAAVIALAVSSFLVSAAEATAITQPPAVVGVRVNIEPGELIAAAFHWIGCEDDCLRSGLRSAIAHEVDGDRRPCVSTIFAANTNCGDPPANRGICLLRRHCVKG
jgi:hypothetical protein